MLVNAQQLALWKHTSLGVGGGVVSANFCGVITPTSAHCKLPS